MRVRVIALAGIAAGCFDDPPSIDPTAAGTSTSIGATVGASTSVGPGSAGESSTTTATTADPDSSSTGGPTVFTCDAPDVFEYARVSAANGSTFGAVGPTGDGLWVFGTHQPADAFVPATWPIDGDAIGQQVLADPDPVELSAFVPGMQPLAVYHQIGLRAVLLDNPAVNDWVELGQWDVGNDNGFRDVVRDGNFLWGAGFDTDSGGKTFWQVVRSQSNGEGWEPSEVAYVMAAGHAASANAIAIDPTGTLVVAGEAEANDGKQYWVTFVYAAGGPPGDPVDSAREGSARAAEIVDDLILVAGANPDGGAIRTASLANPEFDQGALLDRPIVDLALAPGGVVLALGSYDTGEAGWSLWLCPDPAAGPGCWTALVAARDVSAPGHAHAKRLFVDGDRVWVAATIDVDAGAPAGQLYRIECG